MRRALVSTPGFRRAFRRFVRRRVELQQPIEETLRLMEEDVFNPKLGTHKLTGELLGLKACSCGYDCRIVFSIEQAEDTEIILLHTVGTHDQVY